MIARSGARRSNANPTALAVNAHGASAAPFWRVQKRLITVTKCKAGADASRLLKGTLRVFAVSDLHTHHRENLAWVQQLSTSAHQQDVLIVAGDISDDLDDLRVTLTALKQRFALVFFCPGNHELWVTEKQRWPAEQTPAAAAAPPVNSDAATAAAPGGDPRPGAQCEWDSQPQPQPQPQPHGAGREEHANVAAQAPLAHPLRPQPQPQQQPGIPGPAPAHARDSAEKLAVVMAACEELGVLVGPARLGRLRVVPLLAWHHKAFDREPDIPGMPRASPLTISDYARCVWPERILSELRTTQYCEAGAQQPRQQEHQQQHQQHQQTHQQTHQPQQQLQRQQLDEAAPMLAIGSVVGGGGGVTSGEAGAAAFCADWGEGGHGSSAVAAWFDALNDAPRSWRTRGSATATSNSTSGVSCISNAGTSCSCSSSSSSSIQGDAAARGGACRAAQQPRKQGGGRGSPPERDEDAPNCLRDQDPRRHQDAETHQQHQQHQLQERRERRRAPPGAEQGEAPGGVRPQEQQQREASRTTAQVQAREHEQTREQVSSCEDGPSCAADVAVRKEMEEEERLQQVQVEAGCGEDVISFSHFLPLQELLPEKRYLTFPNLAKAVGSTYLGERLRRLRPHVHVFGHTHFAWDAVHDGVRYVQAPLAYPSERRYRLRSLVMAAASAPEDRPGGGGGGSGRGGSGGITSDSGASSGIAAAAAATATGPAAAKDDPGVMVVEAEGVDESDEGCLDPRAPSPAPPPAGSSGGHAAAPSHPRDEQQAAERRAAMAGPSPSRPDGEQGQQEGRSAPWPSSCDPRDARWLPLCIYRAEYTVRLHPRADGDAGGGGSCSDAAAAAAEVDPADAGRQPPPTAQLLLRCCTADAAGGAGGFPTTSSAGALVAAAAAAPVDNLGEVEVLEWQSQWCPEQAAMWSSYYKRNVRRPHELQLAPWVAERYSRRLRRNIAKLGAATAPSPPPPLAPAAATTAAAVETAATFANAAGAGRAALNAGGVGFAPGSQQGFAEGGDDGGAGSNGAAGGVGAGDAQALQSDCDNAGVGGDGEAGESEVEETELE